MITRIFYKLWKYSFFGGILCPLIFALLPIIPSKVALYITMCFGFTCACLTIVCFLLAIAAPPVVTVRIERDD